MTITLPDEWKDRLEAGAKRAGAASVEQFLMSLVVDAEADDEDEDPGAGYVPPPELVPRSEADFERMIAEGMNSGPPIRVTPEFWDNLRERIRARAEARRRSDP